MITALSIQLARLSRAVEGCRQLAFSVAAVVMLVGTPAFASGSGPEEQETIYFDIPQQRADISLTRFAEQANLTLIFTFEIARDKSTNRLEGEYTPAEAIVLLLEDTGLKPMFSNDGSINVALDSGFESEEITMNNKTKASFFAILSSVFMSPAASAEDQAPKPVLEEIVVTADRRDSFSSDYVQVGTFRNGRQLDTPLTVSVITEEMLKSQLASQVLDALRNTAGVTMAAINSTVYNNLSIRGIAVENRGNWRLNGALPIVNLIDLPMENKARVEALKGASALYYGFSTPSGIINLVTKRPTSEPINDVRIFGTNHGTFGAHADLARGNDEFGVRINVLGADLDTGVDRTSGERYFGSVALDWNPSEKLSFQFDAEYIYKDITEPTTYRPMNFPANPVLPPLQDPSHNLGSEWFKSPATEYNVMGRAVYRINDAWQVSADVGISDLERDRHFSLFTFSNPTTGDGTLTVELANGNAYKNEFLRTEIAGAFITGALEHELVAGIAQNKRDTENPRLVNVPFAQNYYNPVEVPHVPLPAREIPNPSTITDLGIYAFDRISYKEWLQVTLGVRSNDYEDRGLTGIAYETSPTTFSGSVMVKPREWLAVYGSYIEGLENARVAPSTAVNAGESLPAATSEQWEFGVKAQIKPGVLATLAWFDIDQESSYLNTANVFVLDGEANYQGVELGFSGEIFDGVSVYASALWLETEQVSGSANIGNDIQNAPPFSGSIFVEYRPESFSQLALSGGIFRVGERAGNAQNTFYVPGYTTFDLGANYTTDIFGRETTFTLFWENITEKRYWAAAGSSLIAPGLPSTIRMSASVSF